MEAFNVMCQFFQILLHRKIPLNPPFPKGDSIFPSLEKRGQGRFYRYFISPEKNIINQK